jgi:hypothetical protein
MKYLIQTLLAAALIPAAVHLHAQQSSSQGFTYQGVARNSNGTPMADQSLTVRLGIYADGLEGELVWQEEHQVQTSSLGLFTLVAGGPEALPLYGIVDSFDDIDWTAHPYYLQVSLRTDGDFIDMGGSPIQAVPLARHAASASSASSSFSVQPRSDAQPGEALFEVKRSDGQPVFAVYEDMVWVYVDTTEKKGVKGGFAVGGFSRSKGVTQEYLRISPDSVRVYIDTEQGSKGVKGGFAVGGFSRNNKGAGDDLYFNLSPSSDPDVIIDKSQILFYPAKDAFLAGTIHIGSADSVGQNSTSLGYKSIAMGRYSQAFGYESMALGDYSTAIGREAAAMENSFALGNSAVAVGNDSYAFGSAARASGEKSFAFGSVGIDTLGIPTGVPTTATGNYSIAFGMGARATNTGAMSMGASSLAEGWKSVAIGPGSTASGYTSTAMGYLSEANGTRSVAIGSYYSYTYYEIIKGGGFKPIRVTRENSANGNYSVSLGNGNYSNNGGFALGTFNDASAFGAMALGFSNTASGKYSLAAGYNNETTGYYSMAFGENLYSQSLNSVAVGTFNEILGDTSSWVETDPLFQVGNGSDSGNRHDALRISKNGQTVAYPVNATYGIYSYSLIDADYTGTNAYGIRSYISKGNSEVNYWSGYFYDDKGILGTYYGLYADVRTGDGFDVAEYYHDSQGDTEAGDVLVADPGNAESVLRSSEPYQTSVLGVVSTDPHLVMGMDLVMDEETGDPKEGVQATRLALSGRVPVKVTEENGPIEPGDLLTTSSISGRAMKWTLLDVNQAGNFEELKSMLAENERRRNAVIGKAVSSSSGTGTVLVLIALQ